MECGAAPHQRSIRFTDCFRKHTGIRGLHWVGAVALQRSIRFADFPLRYPGDALSALIDFRQFVEG
jgi:hypothetical protein